MLQRKCKSVSLLNSLFMLKLLHFCLLPSLSPILVFLCIFYLFHRSIVEVMNLDRFFREERARARREVESEKTTKNLDTQLQALVPGSTSSQPESLPPRLWEPSHALHSRMAVILTWLQACRLQGAQKQVWKSAEASVPSPKLAPGLPRVPPLCILEASSGKVLKAMVTALKQGIELTSMQSWDFVDVPRSHLAQPQLLTPYFQPMSVFEGAQVLVVRNLESTEKPGDVIKEVYKYWDSWRLDEASPEKGERSKVPLRKRRDLPPKLSCTGTEEVLQANGDASRVQFQKQAKDVDPVLNPVFDGTPVILTYCRSDAVLRSRTREESSAGSIQGTSGTKAVEASMQWKVLRTYALHVAVPEAVCQEVELADRRMSLGGAATASDFQAHQSLHLTKEEVCQLAHAVCNPRPGTRHVPLAALQRAILCGSSSMRKERLDALERMSFLSVVGLHRQKAVPTSPDRVVVNLLQLLASMDLRLLPLGKEVANIMTASLLHVPKIQPYPARGGTAGGGDIHSALWAVSSALSFPNRVPSIADWDGREITDQEQSNLSAFRRQQSIFMTDLRERDAEALQCRDGVLLLQAGCIGGRHVKSRKEGPDQSQVKRQKVGAGESLKSLLQLPLSKQESDVDWSPY